MTRAYTLDTEAARSANSGGNFLTETGKYKGVFVRAEAVTSRQKTDGVEFTFKAEDGREAPYLTLWTHKEDGTALYGLKVLNAIMTCLSAREIKPVDGMIDKWDGTAKVPTKATLFPALMGKPIGLLLQRAEYEKTDGTIGHKVEIFAAFEAASEKTAAEILDRQPAGGLARMVEHLADKPLGGKKAKHVAASAPAAANFDDDIPF